MQDILRTWAEVDLNALVSNFNQIKSVMKPGNKAIVVVKANAYGHGSIEVAKELSKFADAFATATLEEATELRIRGVENEIIVLSPIPSDLYGNAIRYKVTPVLFNREDADKMDNTASGIAMPANYYLAVDSGMSRIGVSCDQSGIDTAEYILSKKNICCRGILSHYACADSENSETSEKQKKAFDFFIETLKKKYGDLGIVSINNTAAVINSFPSYNADRIGIAVYGMYPSDNVRNENVALKPVMTLKTRISMVKTVKAGSGIGYGHTYITDSEKRIATLSAGYADGIPIELSNNGRVIINGKFAKILGKICMDQFMVDVSDIPDVKSGDSAVIFGTDGNLSISADEVAKEAGILNYSLVCGIDSRVPRVYIKDNKIQKIFSYISFPYEW
ncbi:MAG: alanine racemase [Clostridiales bacterium]|nr:alanine racemase [Clostridiales bacterium]